MSDAKQVHTVQVQIPDAGQVNRYELTPNGRLALGFSVEDAIVRNEGRDLVFRVEGKGDVVFSDYYGMAQGESAPAFLFQGQEVPGDTWLPVFENVENAEEIETAAGVVAGGGLGEYKDVAGSLFSGVDRLDGQGDSVQAERTFPADEGVFRLLRPESGSEPQPEAEPEPQPEPIEATPDTNTVTEDVKLSATGNVLDNDSPAGLGVTSLNGQPLGDSKTVNGTYGTLTLNSDGTYTYKLDNDNLAVQALDDGESLIEEFSYTASDGVGSADSTLKITIDGTNDGPVANPDENFVTEDVKLAAEGNILANDTDVDGENLTIKEIAGQAVNEGPTVIDGMYGTLTVNANGAYTYVLNNDDPAVQGLGEGDTLSESFAYTATDGDADASSTLTITINGTNGLPVANADVNTVTEPATGATGNVLANDVIADGSPLHVTEIENSDGTKVAAGTSLAGEHGTLTVNADGTYTYTVTPGLDLPEGSTLTDTFKYSAVDGEGDATGSTLTITINGTNGLACTPQKQNKFFYLSASSS